MKNKTIILFFMTLHSTCFGQLSGLNDECNANYEKPTKGICKLSEDCPEAFTDANKKSVRLNTCGFLGIKHIICCPGEYQRPSEQPVTSAPAANSRYTFSINFNPGSRFRSGGSNSPTIRTPSRYTTQPPTNRGRRSIAKKKCDEYSRVVETELNALPLIKDGKPITSTVTKCTVNATPLISGGQPTDVGEFPHMAAIGYSNPEGGYEFLCGGSLISENVVLTAAHCTYHQQYTEPVMVRLGEHNLRVSDSRASPQDIEIKNIITHPDYEFGKKFHDIALLELNQIPRVDNFTRPACLWSYPVLNAEEAIATGWGQTNFGSPMSDILQKVSLPIFTNEKCKSTSLRYMNRISEGQMCAGDLKGKDSCKGDSGGPLQITSSINQCVFYVIGITSYGVGCGQNNSYGVYTKIYNYIKWIEDNTWPSQ